MSFKKPAEKKGLAVFIDFSGFFQTAFHAFTNLFLLYGFVAFFSFFLSGSNLLLFLIKFLLLFPGSQIFLRATWPVKQ